MREGNIVQAIEWFQNYLSSHPQDYETQFILADLKNKQGMHLAARDQFRQIADSNSVLWKEKAAWNEILLCAQYDWDRTAQERLTSILSDEDHSYYLAAQEFAEGFD